MFGRLDRIDLALELLRSLKAINAPNAMDDERIREWLGLLCSAAGAFDLWDPDFQRPSPMALARLADSEVMSRRSVRGELHALIVALWAFPGLAWALELFELRPVLRQAFLPLFNYCMTRDPWHLTQPNPVTDGLRAVVGPPGGSLHEQG